MAERETEIDPKIELSEKLDSEIGGVARQCGIFGVGWAWRQGLVSVAWADQDPQQFF
jgi:hypothetical protein